MNYLGLIEIFETIAYQHRAISHSEKQPAFVTGNIEEILKTIRNLPLGTTFMALHYDEWGFNDVKSANIELAPAIEVSIATKPGSTKTTFEQEQQLMEETFQITYQVCRRLHQFWYEGQKNDIRFLDLDKTTVKRIWKKNFENCIGWMAEIPMHVKAEPYDPVAIYGDNDN